MITATINGFSAASNEHSAFAVHIKHGDVTHSRLVPLKKMTANQVELGAVQYVCQATRLKDDELVINTTSRYLTQILGFENGQWKSTPKNNIELVNKVRALLTRFKSFVIVIDSNSELMLNLKEKARSVHKKYSKTT